jgi:transcriptional regulator with XRE-family HTH domain
MADASPSPVTGVLNPDADDPALGTAIGATLAAARQAAGLSMRELARRADISQPFLSQVENGHSMPSLATLYRLAGALGVSPSTLMPPVGGDRSAVVVRRGEGTRLPVSDGPGAAEGRLLAAGPLRRLEVVEYDIQAGDDLGEWFESAGEMTVYVARGILDVEVEGAGAWNLSAGDAITHPADLRHRWRSPAGALVVLALAHDSEGPARRRRTVTD